MSALLEHFRFAQPGWLLLLPPALLLLFLRRGRGPDAAVIFPNLAVLVSLGRRVRRTAGGLGLPLAFLALFATILAMARPVWRNQYQSRTASGIDIVIAFDVSLSMDIDDFIDDGVRVKRIDVAKAVVDDFISRRPDDRIGLVAFAGRPRDASPITLDHQWLRDALRQLRLNDQFDRGTVKEQGTAIGSAIAASASRSTPSPSAPRKAAWTAASCAFPIRNSTSPLCAGSPSSPGPSITGRRRSSRCAKLSAPSTNWKKPLQKATP